MKKKLLAVLVTGLLMFGLVGMAQAALTTIGTAQFGGIGTEYNLIWDDDNNGNSVIWLDYTNAGVSQVAHNAWAAGLDSTLTYNIDAAHTVDWDGSSWRLPSAGVNPTSGYNQTTSEMGHLFYNELGLTGGPPTYPWYTDEQLNAEEFNNLIASWYWSGTEYAGNPGSAWLFDMNSGGQNYYGEVNVVDGLAVRNGQVSAVPVPGAIWLLGSGLTGLVVARRKKKALHSL